MLHQSKWIQDIQVIIPTSVVKGIHVASGHLTKHRSGAGRGQLGPMMAIGQEPYINH